MWLYADVLSGFVTGLPGVILLVFGVFQLFVLSGLILIFKKPKWFLIMPLMVFSAGVLLLWLPDVVKSVTGILMGAAFVLFGLSEVVSSLLMSKVKKAPGVRSGGFYSNNIDEQ